MNIGFIHIFEAITLFLIIGKLFQIRKLYRQSTAIRLHNTNKRNIKMPHPSKLSRNKVHEKKVFGNEVLRQTSSIYNRFAGNYSQHNLPLPEVTFSEGLPLAEVTFSSNNEGQHFTNKKSQSKHKVILNNYIEDFFFDSSQEAIQEAIQEAEVVNFKKYKIDSSAEDDFITIEDEHAEVIRAFDSLEKSVCLAR